MLTNATGGQIVTVLIAGIVSMIAAAFGASVFSMGRSNSSLSHTIIGLYKTLMLLALIGMVGWVIAMLFFGVPGPH